MSGGSSDSSSSNRPQLSPSQLVDLYNQSLPSTLATVMNQVPASTLTMAQAATNANPVYTASGLDQLNSYAGGYQQAGARLADAQAKSTSDLLSGSGRSVALNADALARETNPNYYKVQDAASNQSKNLLDSYNLGGLSAGESNAVERGLNQSNAGIGNLGLNNATNTISNAMNFGDAFNAKRAGLASAIGTANSTAASAQNTGFNPVNLAIGAGQTGNNFGLGQFNPIQANNTTTAPMNAATGFGSQLAGNASAGTGASSGSSAQGGLCCFIFLEAYHGTLPVNVRKCRDGYYNAFPKIALGYKRMAKHLVPLMQRFTLVRALVWNTMVKPLTEYGDFVINRDVSKRKHRMARNFWFSVWSMMGRK